MSIRITDAGGKMLGATAKSVVGARIGWTIVGVGGNATEPRWRVSGVEPVVAGYTSDARSARVDRAVDLGSATLEAYWAVAGRLTVSASARVNGRKHETSVSVTIAAPTLIEFTSDTDAVQVARADNPLTGLSSLSLTFGGVTGTTTPGIEWTAKVIAPDSRGHFRFTQLMVVNRLRSKNGVPGDRATSNGAYVLDEVVCYEMEEGQEEKETASCLEWEVLKMVGEDSPAMVLPDPGSHPRYDHDRVEADEQFLTYLMFRPKNGVWIAVARLAWDWRGVATHDGTGWSLHSGGCTADPSGGEWVGFPTWTANRNDIM